VASGVFIPTRRCSYDVHQSGRRASGRETTGELI